MYAEEAWGSFDKAAEGGNTGGLVWVRVVLDK